MKESLYIDWIVKVFHGILCHFVVFPDIPMYFPSFLSPSIDSRETIESISEKIKLKNSKFGTVLHHFMALLNSTFKPSFKPYKGNFFTRNDYLK